MNESIDVAEGIRHDAHRLLQFGGLMLFLGLLVGLAVSRFTEPRLGLSTHLLGVVQGIFLIVGGLLWPKLRLTRSTSRIGHILAIYGGFAAWTARLLGAVWGAGSSTLPIAAAGVRGTSLQEGTIRVLLISAVLSLVTVSILILWGLRTSSRAKSIG